MTSPRRLLLCCSVLAVAFAGCGGDDDDSGSASTPTTAAQAPAQPAPGSGGAIVKIEADPDGSLAYEQTTVSAKAGTVAIELTNEAATPHDVKIEQGDEQLGGTDVISKSTATATLDLEAGDYTFYCSVGGHRAAGMEGTLTVE